MSHQARAIIDYLLKAQGGQTRRVEETPVGMVFTPAEDPDHLWTRYLAQRLVDKSRCRNRPPARILARTKKRSTCGYPSRWTVLTAESSTKESSFSSAGRGTVVSVLEWLRDQVHRVMGGGPLGPGMQRLQRLFPPSLPNRRSQAARFHVDSAGSAVPLKVPESDLSGFESARFQCIREPFSIAWITSLRNAEALEAPP